MLCRHAMQRYCGVICYDLLCIEYMHRDYGAKYVLCIEREYGDKICGAANSSVARKLSS